MSIFKILNNKVGKALHAYNMIDNKDKIAIGLSGGKDSLALIWILTERLKWIPIKYELLAIYIDLGFENSFAEDLKKYAQKSGYEIIIEYANYGILAHSKENRENPCFLCSKLRKKRLFELAVAHNCNKIALGHHKDDIIETLFLNIFYSGEISSMLPYQSLFNYKLAIIRPLAFTDEFIIKKFTKTNNFPEFINSCPSANNSKRHEVKAILNNLYKTNKKIKGNIFSAMSRIKQDYLLKKS